MAHKRTLIVHYTTAQLYGAVVTFIALLIGCVLLGYGYGDKAFSWGQQRSFELQHRVQGLEETLAANKRALTSLQLTAQVDASALEQTRQQLVELQRQIYQRDQELKLYRGMLQDNQQPNGLSVSDLHLKKVSDRRFQYDWVVRQKIHEAKTLRVNAKLWVIGHQNGETLSLPLDKLDAQVDALPIQLRLKYFSINRGILQLPDGFVPESVRVTLRYPWVERLQFDNKFVWRTEE